MRRKGGGGGGRGGEAGGGRGGGGGGGAECSSVEDPPRENADLKRGDREDDDEEDDRDRRRVSGVEERERLHVEVVADRLRRLIRTATSSSRATHSSGKDQDRLHHLERRDDVDQKDEIGSRAQQRPRHAPETGPCLGTIDSRGLVELGREVGEAGQEDHLVVAVVLRDAVTNNPRL